MQASRTKVEVVESLLCWAGLGLAVAQQRSNGPRLAASSSSTEHQLVSSQAALPPYPYRASNTRTQLLAPLPLPNCCSPDAGLGSCLRPLSLLFQPAIHFARTSQTRLHPHRIPGPPRNPTRRPPRLYIVWSPLAEFLPERPCAP